MTHSVHIYPHNDLLNLAHYHRETINRKVNEKIDYLSNRNSDPLSGISRTLVEEMLAALRAVLNRLDLHFRDNTVMYEDFVDESGARLLVHKLRKLERLQGATASAP